MGEPGPEQAADGWDLAPPLANRLVHLDWPVDAAAVAEGLAVGFDGATPAAYAAPEPARLLAAKAAVAAFLAVRPALVLEVPTVAARAGRGWPSPRSWEHAAILLAACETAGASGDARMCLLTGAVGEGAGVEFLSWLAHADLPDPDVVLADPSAFVLPERVGGHRPR